MINDDKYREYALMTIPLFIKIYMTILVTFIKFILDLFKWIIYICIGFPLLALGILLYIFIIKPLKWFLSLFIKIESVNIYE